MREIKFRAWDIVGQRMLSSDDLWDIPFNEIFIHTPDQRAFNLMQYTGLKDRNGEEIYEHDVLMIVAEDENQKEIGREKCVVDFDRQAFVFAPSLKHRGLTQDSLFKRYKANYLRWELLGNIYENPELLEK